MQAMTIYFISVSHHKSIKSEGKATHFDSIYYLCSVLVHLVHARWCSGPSHILCACLQIFGEAGKSLDKFLSLRLNQVAQLADTGLGLDAASELYSLLDTIFQMKLLSLRSQCQNAAKSESGCKLLTMALSTAAMACNVLMGGQYMILVGTTWHASSEAAPELATGAPDPLAAVGSSGSPSPQRAKAISAQNSRWDLIKTFNSVRKHVSSLYPCLMLGGCALG